MCTCRAHPSGLAPSAYSTHVLASCLPACMAGCMAVCLAGWPSSEQQRKTAVLLPRLWVRTTHFLTPLLRAWTPTGSQFVIDGRTYTVGSILAVQEGFLPDALQGQGSSPPALHAELWRAWEAADGQRLCELREWVICAYPHAHIHTRTPTRCMSCSGSSVSQLLSPPPP